MAEVGSPSAKSLKGFSRSFGCSISGFSRLRMRTVSRLTGVLTASRPSGVRTRKPLVPFIPDAGSIRRSCSRDSNARRKRTLELLAQLAQLVKVESIRGSLIADLDSCGLAIDHAAYGRSLALNGELAEATNSRQPALHRKLANPFVCH